MALKPDTEYQQPRLLGDETSENVTLIPGQLEDLSLGVWMLEGNDTIQGSSDAEFIVGNQDNDRLLGGSGTDSLFGGQNNDYVDGEIGDDFVRGDKDEDTVLGGEGNDSLFGGQSSDQLDGNAGNDTLYGDLGADTLRGNEGNDIFFLRVDQTDAEAKFDRITDFKSNEDLIGLQGELKFEDLTFVADPDDSTNTRILDSNNQIVAILESIDPESLTRSDFIVPGVLSFNLSNYNLNEDGTASTPLTVLRSNGSDGEVSVNIRLANYSSWDSISSKDYQETPITVTFGDGDTTPKPVTIPVIDDRLWEYPEYTDFSLENPTNGATIAFQEDPAILTLLDNEPKNSEPTRTYSPTTEFGDFFGTSIATLNNNLLVGSLDDTYPVNGGIVYLFDTDTGEVLRTFQKPSGIAAGLIDPFGTSIAVLDNTIFVGSPFNNDPTATDTSGAVYQFDATTGEVLRTFRNPNPGQYDYFGTSIAVQDNKILIGANREEGTIAESGTAYLFDSNTGELLLSFVNPDASGRGFGSSVAFVGDQVVIAAPGDNATPNGDKGAVFLFDGTTGELLQTFRGEDSQLSDDFFGASIDVLDNDILIGAPSYPGVIYRFDSETGELVQKYSFPEQPDLFGFGGLGWTVETVGDDILAGVSSHERRGAVFHFDGTTGELLEAYFNPDQNILSGYFGADIAVQENKIFIASPNSFNSSGFVYEF